MYFYGDVDVDNRLLDRGMERVGRMEGVAWKHLYYHM